VHVKNVKLDPNIELKQVASITSGFVGADLSNLVNEAALLAARKGKTSVGMDEFNEGVERVTPSASATAPESKSGRHTGILLLVMNAVALILQANEILM
jgi:ATP-dependent Zn protease